MDMHKNLDALTSLRGIAAVFIVLHHLTVYFLPDINQAVSDITPFFEKNYLWVDFFFVLSGFILYHVYQTSFLSHRQRKYKQYLVSRFARIYPVHILMILVLLSFEILKLISGQGRPFTGEYTLLSLIANVFLFQVFFVNSTWNQPAWSISAEWLIYLIFPFLIRAVKINRRWLDIIIMIVCFGLLFLLSRQKHSLDFVSWKSLVRCGLEMIIGIMAYKQRQLKGLQYNKGLTVSVLLFLVLVSMCFPINHIISVMIFVPLVVSASTISRHRLYTNSYLMFLGKISYSIYMIHWPLFVLAKNSSKYAFKKIQYQNIGIHNQCFIALSLLMFVIALSIPLFSLFEDPLRRYYKNLDSGKNSEITISQRFPV